MIKLKTSGTKKYHFGIAEVKKCGKTEVGKQ
jgi:hypothetical protein